MSANRRDSKAVRHAGTHFDCGLLSLAETALVTVRCTLEPELQTYFVAETAALALDPSRRIFSNGTHFSTDVPPHRLEKREFVYNLKPVHSGDLGSTRLSLPIFAACHSEFPHWSFRVYCASRCKAVDRCRDARQFRRNLPNMP